MYANSLQHPQPGPQPVRDRGLLRAGASGFDAGDGAFAVVRDPNRGVADGDGAGFGADLDRGAGALAAFEIDPGHRVLGGASDPDGGVASVDPARTATDFDRVADHGVDR